MTASQAPGSPVSQEVSTELERVVERWRQLPLDHALSHAGKVRALAQSLADEVAQATGIHPRAIPDCGPATLMDQLTVTVYDANAATAAGTRTSAVTSAGISASGSTLAQDLVALRRELH